MPCAKKRTGASGPILNDHFRATRARVAASQGPILVQRDTTDFSRKREGIEAVGKTPIFVAGAYITITIANFSSTHHHQQLHQQSMRPDGTLAFGHLHQAQKIQHLMLAKSTSSDAAGRVPLRA